MMGGHAVPPAAIILAAGASLRFGGRPKALLPIGAESALGRVLRVARSVGCRPIVTVVGAHRQEIQDGLRSKPDQPDEWVQNDRWEDGRTGSAQAGLREVPEDANVLLWPVDCPLVRESTVERLFRAADQDALGLWFLPEYRGTGGHPVVWKPPVRDAVSTLAPNAPLRTLLSRLALSVVRVPVEDAGVVTTFDTPQQYQNAMASWFGRE